MATYDFFTGWEHGSVADSPGTGMFAVGEQLPESIGTNAPTIETSIVHHGTKALRCATTGANTSYWRIDVAADATQHIVTSLYFYIVTMPTADAWLYTHFTSAGGQIILIDSSGVIKALPANRAADQQTGPTLTTGQWYRLDVYSNTSGTQHTIDWMVDGVAQTQAVTTNSPGADTADSYGIGNGLSGATATFIYDCFAASHVAGDYPLPDTYVLGYAPNEDADITQVGTGAFVDAGGTAISAGNPAWDNLDSRDFGQSSERVEQTANAIGGYIAVGFEDSAESSAPLAVMIEAALRADSTSACTAEVVFISSGVGRGWGSGDPSESSNVRGWICDNLDWQSGNPAWTTDAFNALTARIGFSSDANPDPWFTALLLEALFPAVTFDPATQGAGIFQPESLDLQMAE